MKFLEYYNNYSRDILSEFGSVPFIYAQKTRNYKIKAMGFRKISGKVENLFYDSTIERQKITDPGMLFSILSKILKNIDYYDKDDIKEIFIQASSPSTSLYVVKFNIYVELNFKESEDVLNRLSDDLEDAFPYNVDDPDNYGLIFNYMADDPTKIKFIYLMDEDEMKKWNGK